MTQALLLLTMLGMAGYASVGPRTVTWDRFDCTGAVAESSKSQMLLNLVKLRYGDAPVFLNVGQIISGYTVEGTLSADGAITSSHGVVAGVSDSSVIRDVGAAQGVTAEIRLFPRGHRGGSQRAGSPRELKVVSRGLAAPQWETFISS